MALLPATIPSSQFVSTWSTPRRPARTRVVSLATPSSSAFSSNSSKSSSAFSSNSSRRSSRATTATSASAPLPDVAPPAPDAGSGSTAARDAKLRLLQAAAGTNRGALASPAQATHIGSLLRQLEALDSDVQPGDGQLESALLGTWRLVYASVEPFRSSPFFWAFQSGLVGNDQLAGAVFAFTDAIPGAVIGQAEQLLSPGLLESRVELAVFPGVRGVVVTSSRVLACERGPGGLRLAVESTRIEGSNVTPFLEGLPVPVERVFGALRGPDAAQVSATVTYVDADCRVTRTQDGEAFVYTRLA